MQVGDLIEFGCYEWRVLDVRNDKALIITEGIVERRTYHKIYKDITWNDSDIRKYLNNEFYNKFDETDKLRITTVLNKNPDNPWYGTNCGEEEHDKIFLLCLEEVCNYFGDSSEKLNNRGNNRYWKKNDENNSKRLAYIDKRGTWWWWLRSSGRTNRFAAYVHGTDGCVGVNGNNVTNPNGGIRPAMWIRLS